MTTRGGPSRSVLAAFALLVSSTGCFTMKLDEALLHPAPSIRDVPNESLGVLAAWVDPATDRVSLTVHARDGAWTYEGRGNGPELERTTTLGPSSTWGMRALVAERSLPKIVPRDLAALPVVAFAHDEGKETATVTVSLPPREGRALDASAAEASLAADRRFTCSLHDPPGTGRRLVTDEPGGGAYAAFVLLVPLTVALDFATYPLQPLFIFLRKDPNPR